MKDIEKCFDPAVNMRWIPVAGKFALFNSTISSIVEDEAQFLTISLNSHGGFYSVKRTLVLILNVQNDQSRSEHTVHDYYIVSVLYSNGKVGIDEMWSSISDIALDLEQL